MRYNSNGGPPMAWPLGGPAGAGVVCRPSVGYYVGSQMKGVSAGGPPATHHLAGRIYTGRWYSARRSSAASPHSPFLCVIAASRSSKASVPAGVTGSLLTRTAVGSLLALLSLAYALQPMYSIIDVSGSAFGPPTASHLVTGLGSAQDIPRWLRWAWCLCCRRQG